MRAGTVLAFLLVASPFLPAFFGGEAAGAGDGNPHGRGLPGVTNDSLDISFEKSEYLEWNLSGNITINITFASKTDSDETVSISSYFETYYGSTPNVVTSSDLDKKMYLFLSPFEVRVLHVNLTVKPYRNDYYFRMMYLVGASNDHIHSQNFTTIVSFGQYSLRVIDPVPSMGECHVLIGNPITIGINVTNYSDRILSGRLLSNGDARAISLGPKSSVITYFNISPEYIESRNIYMFSLSTNDTLTTIGFDMENGVATNITDAYITVIAHELLKIEIQERPLELAVPGQVNITVTSGMSSVLRNIFFKVDINGWLNERISHGGDFTVDRIEPWSSVNVSYNIIPHVAGRFNMEISAVLQGTNFSTQYVLIIVSQAGPKVINKYSAQFPQRQGNIVFINGTITNNYPYALRDVKLTVMLEKELHGFLSRDDFMAFRPAEMVFDVLESGQTVDFAFNITMNSPGIWKFGVVALWGGNASSGGDASLVNYYVSRPQFSYSMPGVIASIVILTAVPKIMDLVIRRMRKIGS